jgi:hypothetical protein
MSDQFDTVNAAIRDHLIARYPQIEVSAMDGLRLPLGKVKGTRLWIRLGLRPGQRAFMRAMIAASAKPGDAMPVWMASLADAAAHMAPSPLRQVLEPAARELPTFDHSIVREGVGFALHQSRECIIWNRNLVRDADAPKEWEDLMDPRWRGRIRCSPTASGRVLRCMSWQRASSAPSCRPMAWRATAA